MDELIDQSGNDGGVSRTAPATPGLLIRERLNIIFLLVSMTGGELNTRKRETPIL